MNKIPKNIKYAIFGISALLFFTFNSMLGLNLIISSINWIQKITGFYFAISTNPLDYLAFASIPFFGMLLHSTRPVFKKSQLIMDILTVLISVIIVSSIGLYFLTIIGKPTNPLIPQFLITEPFSLYSTLIVGIGILIPFLCVKRSETKTEIKNKEI